MGAPLFDQYLAETSARAAFIVRDGKLWAQAGEVPGNKAEQLSTDLWKVWAQRSKGDVLRFVNLTQDQQPYRLFATHLANNYLLALVYSGAIPLSQMRLQAVQLGKLLVTGEGSTPSVINTPIQTARPVSGKSFVETTQAWRQEIDGAPAPTSAAKIAMLQRLEESTNQDQTEAELEEELANQFSAAPAWEGKLSLEVSRTQPLPAKESSLTSSAFNLGFTDSLEPAVTTVYNLAYTCILLPRFPHRFLVGDLADQLPRWFLQICLAFGWRLESLTVRSHYLHWIVRTSPSTSPATMLRVIRQQTSQRIFDQFVDLKAENPAGDFWAPGYLVLSGAHVASTQLLREYIVRTRQRQGL